MHIRARHEKSVVKAYAKNTHYEKKRKRKVQFVIVALPGLFSYLFLTVDNLNAHKSRVMRKVPLKHMQRTHITKKKSKRKVHNHKPQPFSDPKRKRKPTNLNKHKPNKRTKSTKISSLFPKRGNKNKMTHGKTYNKSPHAYLNIMKILPPKKWKKKNR